MPGDKAEGSNSVLLEFAADNDVDAIIAATYLLDLASRNDEASRADVTSDSHLPADGISDPNTTLPATPSIPSPLEKKQPSPLDRLIISHALEEFMMYTFKIRMCSRADIHDWDGCPFVHPKDRSRRRDPRLHSYSHVPCPEFQTQGCDKGDACSGAHGTWESLFHPANYRTQLCTAGSSCTNGLICSFAHSNSLLRSVQHHPSGPSGGNVQPRPGHGNPRVRSNVPAPSNLEHGSRFWRGVSPSPPMYGFDGRVVFSPLQQQGVYSTGTMQQPYQFAQAYHGSMGQVIGVAAPVMSGLPFLPGQEAAIYINQQQHPVFLQPSHQYSWIPPSQNQHYIQRPS